ncbi:LINE-1 reverse transcriptase-like isoform B [Glycine soja]|uniref:LINE-1 reverse transcriptase-like isoform B n=1 Tax=Glycine soja TaxID=3848 RepID=A0A445G836_GLYSO|nr:LINE-1 reverse transcriptase-like isoform B [Glycine soja]
MSVRLRTKMEVLRTSFAAIDHRNARRRYLHLHAGTLNAATLTNKTQCRTKKRKREKAQQTKMESCSQLHTAPRSLTIPLSLDSAHSISDR